MKISVIIPTKDRGEVFNLTLQHAIEALEGIDAEIIVINDSKTSLIHIPESQVEIRLFNNPKSGVAAARNLGAAKAKGELYLFLDDDILIAAENMHAILKVHHEHPSAAINLLWVYPPALLEEIRHTSFGRFLIRYGFTTMKEGLGNQWSESEIIETEVAASFFLFMHRDTYLKSGGYNEQFPHAGSEDHDFSMRLKELGVNRLVFTKSLVYHNEKDRMKIADWMKREKRGAETRAWGHAVGHEELKLEFPHSKYYVYQLLSKLKPLLFSLQMYLPDSPSLDFLNHRIIHLLLGTSIFQGYQKGLSDAGKRNP